MEKNDIKQILNSIKPRETSVIIVDLKAIENNYKNIKKLAPNAKIGASVKANCYGLGIDAIMPCLLKQGCNHYFVATINEAIEARKLAPKATIYTLNGLIKGTIDDYIQYNISPVLSSLNQIQYWVNTEKPAHLCAALQLDTGMNRLGLKQQEVELLSQQYDDLKSQQINLIVSHFASADDSNAQQNTAQSSLFNQIISHPLFKDMQFSLANSAAIHMGEENHYDIIRPGISLYGGQASDHNSDNMECAVYHFSKVISIRYPNINETIGYSATYKVENPMVVATIASGYADGISRHLSFQKDGSAGCAYFQGGILPFVGRVSMDLMTLDASNIDCDISEGDWVELLGKNIKVSDVSKQAGTIDYEIFTNLSTRAKRIYV